MDFKSIWRDEVRRISGCARRIERRVLEQPNQLSRVSSSYRSRARFHTLMGDRIRDRAVGHLPFNRFRTIEQLIDL